MLVRIDLQKTVPSHIGFTDDEKLALIADAEPMMWRIIHSLEVPYALHEDAIQAAKLGFLRAAQNFDARHGVKLTTYAWSYIIGEVREVVRSNWPLPGLAEDDGEGGDEEAAGVEDIPAPPAGVDLEDQVFAQDFFRDLPPGERELMFEIFFEGSTQTAAAGRRGISRMTVSRQVARVVERARAEAA